MSNNTKILIVDDKPENLLLLEKLLKGLDLNILKASSGSRAIDILSENEVALILLDVRMPGQDGFETAELIRNMEKTKTLPIIFITAYSKGHEYIFKGYEKGAVDYLVKPIQPEILKAKVKVFVELFRKRKDLENRTIELKSEIAERRKIEKALTESEAKHRGLYETMVIGVIFQDSLGKLISANLSAEKIFGMELNHMTGGDLITDSLQAVNIDGTSVTKENFPSSVAIRTGNDQINKIMGIHNPEDKTIRWVNVTSIPQFMPFEAEPYQVYTTLEDFTERKVAQEAVEESEKKYRSLFNTSRDGIAIMDMAGRIQEANQAYLDMMGRTAIDILYRYTSELMQKEPERDEEEQRRQQLLSRGYTEVFEKEYIHSDGRVFPVSERMWLINDSKGMPFRILSHVRDISEQKRLEGQLRQAQKMEAVGTLAGGIAHDFNNILGAIMGYVELTHFEIPEENQNAHQNLNEVMRAAHRAKELICHILAFSRQSEQERKPVILPLIIKETLKLIKATIPSTIKIRHEIDKGIKKIYGDPTQIHQVLMNLCTNAYQSMSETGGSLTISLNSAVIDLEGSAYPELSPGRYAVISVKDTGRGIDPSICDRIFDPYFTTKEKEDGTGLGLAVVHGIIKNHRGAITVESKPGEGTAFKVFFPEMIEDEKDEVVTPMPLLRGTERILFVDDEEPLANLGKKMLELLGYDVTSKTISTEAYNTFYENPYGFDLVITDMTMPEMTGEELSEKISNIRPDLPIILCTGYNQKLNEDKLSSLPIRCFLMKPLDMVELARAVRLSL